MLILFQCTVNPSSSIHHSQRTPFIHHLLSIILHGVLHGVSLFRTSSSFLRLCGSSSFIQVCNSSSLLPPSLFNSVNHQVFFDCMSPICLNGAPHALWRPTCLTAPICLNGTPDVPILIPMTKGQDKRSWFHHHCHHPTFFLFNTHNYVGQPKGVLGSIPRVNL